MEEKRRGLCEKDFLIILAVVLCVGALFLPIPRGIYRDGGTRDYQAILYRKVEWNRTTEDEVHSAKRWYWFPKNFQSLNTLWEDEKGNVVYHCLAKVKKISGGKAIIQPLDGEPEGELAQKIQISTEHLEEIGAHVGCIVEISYQGQVMPVCVLGLDYTHQIAVKQWKLIEKNPVLQ